MGTANARKITLDQSLSQTVLDYWVSVLEIRPGEEIEIDNEIARLGKQFFMTPAEAKDLIGFGMHHTDEEFQLFTRERYLLCERIYEIGYDIMCTFDAVLRHQSQEVDLPTFIPYFVGIMLDRVRALNRESLTAAYKVAVHYMLLIGFIVETNKRRSSTHFIVEPVIRAGYSNLNSVVPSSPAFSYYEFKRNEDIYCSLVKYNNFIEEGSGMVDLLVYEDAVKDQNKSVVSIIIPELL